MAEVIDLSSDQPEKCTFYLPGNPVPLPRSRFNRSKSRCPYNPANKKKKECQRLIKEQVSSCSKGPLFPSNIPVTLNVYFCIRRPNEDFKGQNRERSELKGQRRNLFAPVRKPDLDNLLKFILDAMQGVIYTDDTQVVSIVCARLMDNFGSCDGGTYVELQRHRAVHMPIPAHLVELGPPAP